MNVKQQVEHKYSNAENVKLFDFENLPSMESSHRPRTYSHLSEVSVALSHSDLVENVPDMDTKMSDDPPDGGYGWCIVLATCFCNFVLIHSRICYGLFIPELTDYFERSQTDMSLVASTDAIVRCISCEYNVAYMCIMTMCRRSSLRILNINTRIRHCPFEILLAFTLFHTLTCPLSIIVML